MTAVSQAMRWLRRGPTAAIVATAVGLIPFVVVLVQVLAADQAAIHGDGALIELRVRDTGTADTPLLGSYQRFGWHMPGPLSFYLLVIPYRLLGSNFSGLQVGALLINAAAFVGVAAVVHRRHGTIATLWAVLLQSVLVQAFGPERISDPWEPTTTTLPFVLFLVLTASLAAGSTWALPWGVGVGTYLAQAQGTLAPTVAVVLVLGGAALAWHLWRRSADTGRAAVLRAVRRPAAATVAVLVVLWFPPLLHELSGAPSNIGRLVAFTTAPNDVLGLGDALSALALQFGHRAGWITGEIPTIYGSGIVDLSDVPVVPLSFAVLTVATVVAVVRRADRSAALGITVLVTSLVGILTLSRLVGDLFNWILLWTWGLGMSVWLAAGICGWRSIEQPGRRAAGPWVGAGLGLGLVAVVAVSVSGADDLAEPPDRVRRAVLELADDTISALAHHDGPVLVRSELTSEVVFGGAHIGVEPLVNSLERAGVDARVPPDLELKFGDHRTAADADVDVEVVLVHGDELPDGPDTEVVGTVPALLPSQEAEVVNLRTELADQGVGYPEVGELPAGPDGDLIRIAVGRLRQLEADRPIAVVVRPVDR